ncbi:MAG TPA: hypothetical protein VIG08_06055 [Gemmatimonadales bacterium]|jgi:hypothetical protein
MRRLLFLLTLAGPLAGRLHAQQLGTPFPSVDRPAEPTHPSIPAFPRGETHPAVLALGGVAGGAVGVFAGALAGAKLTEHDCEDCALVGAVYGAIAGGSAVLPLGVHLANRGRGNFALSLLSSLAIGGVGLAIAHEANSAAVMIPVPVLQVVSSILIERRTEE